MPTQKIVLSKTKLKQNDQCARNLWLEVNKREVGVWNGSEQSRFDQGRMIEQIARDEFPSGTLMNKIKNIEKISETKKLLKTSDVIFEAAFVANRTIVQFDILIKKADGTYKAIEVKSGTKLKDDYLDDVTIQYWISVRDGKIVISEYEVWYVNNQATGKSQIFKKDSVTDHVLKSEARFQQLLEEAEATLVLKEEPKNPVGIHCSKPYSCKFAEYCSKDMNKGPDSVTNLPFFAHSKWKALALGIDSINHAEFDKTYTYSTDYPIVAQAIRENRLVVDQDKIKEMINSWIHPIMYFDFETLNLAVPLLEGQKPYEQVVIQFSNHIVHEDGTVEHHEYLHDNLSNPDLGAIKSILKSLGTKGSIVSYNKPFEMSRIKELALRHPEYREQLLTLLDRFVDLMDIKEFIYHPDFMGSFSLKSVSPVLLGEYGSYSDSLIANGGEIAQYYTEFVTTQDPVRKEEIRQALLRYCGYDVLNLKLIRDWLLDQTVDLKALVESALLIMQPKAA